MNGSDTALQHTVSYWHIRNDDDFDDVEKQKLFELKFLQYVPPRPHVKGEADTRGLKMLVREGNHNLRIGTDLELLCVAEGSTWKIAV